MTKRYEAREHRFMIARLPSRKGFSPGAMSAPLDSLLFWGSLALSLVVAGVAAYPVNRWLIARGRGHAVVHAHH